MQLKQGVGPPGALEGSGRLLALVQQWSKKELRWEGFEGAVPHRGIPLDKNTGEAQLHPEGHPPSNRRTSSIDDAAGIG
ncbi:MAG: hypothetical protein ACKO6N_15775 [Myxococcota bacterium]